jgi:O-acetyl-ADP-ribose deacetylase (regulator of RNase III)
MIKQIKSDIFAVSCDMIVHQANCQHNMGSGIARFIRENFPEAYEADCKTKLADPNKLGTFSYAKVKNPKYPNIGFIVNLYSQFDFSSEKRCTNYEAFASGLETLRDLALAKVKNPNKKYTVAIPYRIGSNRGGGSWAVIKAIIESVFENEPNFTVIICEPPEQEAIQNKMSR